MSTESYSPSYYTDYIKTNENNYNYGTINYGNQNFSKFSKIDSVSDMLSNTGNNRLLKTFIEFKEAEIKALELKKQKEKEEIIGETKEHIDKEKWMHIAKDIMYKKLNIDSNLEKNSKIKQFFKGFVDELVIGNFDLAIDIINTNGMVLLKAIQHMMTREGIKQISQSFKDSFWNLFTGNAYEKGKSFVQLGLVGTGLGLVYKIGKTGIKQTIKESIKKSAKLTRSIGSNEVRHQMSSVSGLTNKILNKTELNFKEFKFKDFAKLPLEERELAASYILKRDLKPGEFNGIKEAMSTLKKGNGISNVAELREKINLLTNSGFTREEARELIKSGVCGKIKSAELIDIEKLKGIKNIEKLSIDEIKDKIKELVGIINFEALVKNPKYKIMLIDKLKSLPVNLSHRIGKTIKLEKENIEGMQREIVKLIAELENLEKKGLELNYSSVITQKVTDKILSINKSYLEV